jgi:taurine dioxygenase
MQVTQLNTSIGATVSGVDIAQNLSESLVTELRSLWLEHQVIVLREQHLSPAQLLALAALLGEADTYPFLTGLPGYPQVTEVLKKEDETVNFGGVWHTDTIYQQCPPMATLVYALEIPPCGGDTVFASQYAACSSLSDGLKNTLRGMTAISRAGNKAVAATRAARIEEQGTGVVAEALSAEHPVIRTHPETGKHSLYVSPAHTTHFAGWTEDESADLLQCLFTVQIRHEWCCRHQWRVGDLALWDNRCTLHYPVNDYHGHRRLLHRVTLKGDQPVCCDVA